MFADAGTNAKVFLTMYGQDGESGKRELKEDMNAPDKDLFERGEADRFLFESPELGVLCLFQMLACIF